MPSTACSTPCARTILPSCDAEPNLVAISGRPAYMLVGGEIGYQVTNALSGTMVGFKEYGTRLDFVPIVLGNGRMHIDVRARVSEPDAANGAGGIPSLTTREAETGVELRAGQTLAIAGLIEHRVEATQPRSAVDQRNPLPGRALSLGQPSDQRDRADRARHAGDRRRHGARPGAGLPARHGDDRSQRLGTVLQRSFGSSQLLPGRPAACPNCLAGGSGGGSSPGDRPDQPAKSAESFHGEPDGHESAACRSPVSSAPSATTS